MWVLCGILDNSARVNPSQMQYPTQIACRKMNEFQAFRKEEMLMKKLYGILIYGIFLGRLLWSLPQLSMTISLLFGGFESSEEYQRAFQEVLGSTMDISPFSLGLILFCIQIPVPIFAALVLKKYYDRIWRTTFIFSACLVASDLIFWNGGALILELIGFLLIYRNMKSIQREG